MGLPSTSGSMHRTNRKIKVIIESTCNVIMLRYRDDHLDNIQNQWEEYSPDILVLN